MKFFSYVFIATIVARLSSLISFPVTTRVLSVADMGDLTIWHSVRGIILLGLLLGLPDIVAREAGAHKSQRSFIEALKVSYAMLALVAIGMELLLQFAPSVVGIPHPRLLLLAAAIDVIPALFLNTLAAMGKIRAYVVCIVVPAVFVASLSVMLVLPPFSLGLAGPLYAHVAASAVNALICLWMWRSHQEPVEAPVRTAGLLLRQSIPVLGVSLIGISIATIDRYSIRWFLGSAAVGFYAVAFQVAALLSFGGAAVRTSLISKIIAAAEKRDVITRYFNDYVVCGSMFAVVLAGMAPEIIRLLAGPKYDVNVQLVPLLCAALLGLELYSFGQALAVAQRQSQRAFYSIGVGAAVALILVPLLCYLLGSPGVALGLLAAYLAAAVTLLARRVGLARRAWACLGFVAIALLALAIEYRQVDSIHTVWSMAVRYPLAAACAGIGLLCLHNLGKESAT